MAKVRLDRRMLGPEAVKCVEAKKTYANIERTFLVCADNQLWRSAKHENGRGWRGAVERLVDFGFRGVLSCFGVWVLENVGLLNDSKCAIS